MHKITNLWKFEHDCSAELQDNYERKNTLLNVTRSCVLSDAWFRDLEILIVWGLKIEFMENYFFLETYVTLEGAVFKMFYTINLSPLLVTK